MTQPDRARRLDLLLARDGPTCVWCGRSFTALVTPTTEHVVPRVKGGPSDLANEVAACRRCNGRRGHRRPGEWIEECRRLGWRPDEDRLVRSLREVAADGPRRARAYAVSDLRRLRA